MPAAKPIDAIVTANDITFITTRFKVANVHLVHERRANGKDNAQIVQIEVRFDAGTTITLSGAPARAFVQTLMRQIHYISV